MPGNKGRCWAARVRAARFPQVKTLDDFDFTFQRSIDRKQPVVTNLLRRSEYQRWSYTLNQIDPAGSLLDV